MSEEQMIYIIKNNLIDQCNEQEKRKVFNFAFGEEFYITSIEDNEDENN